MGNSFVYSLRNDSTFEILKCSDKRYEVLHESYYLCGFGMGGSTLRI